MPHVLVVEDEQSIREMICFVLEQADYTVSQAIDVESARRAIIVRPPQLILLDWMLPKESGLQFVKELRKSYDTKRIPVIMLTAKADEASKVTGLDVGVDDYVTKPFSPKELLARIRAVLRRGQQVEEAHELVFGNMRIDIDSQRVYISGQPIHLPVISYRLLLFLLRNPKRLHTREQILNAVWGHHVDVGDRAVDTQIRRLRSSLKEHGLENIVMTIHGSGYRLNEDLV